MVARSYYDVLTAAINDMVEHGFDNMERVNYWTGEIRMAAEKSQKSNTQMEQDLRDVLSASYRRYIDNGGYAKFHQGVNRFTVERLRPALRLALDRRLAASRDLIVLNRKQMMAKTEQRFRGWATSIPAGGTDVAKRAEIKEAIRKPLASAPFEERRVLIDQGHKMVGSLSEIIARDGSAIAGIWNSNWRTPNYDYRDAHRDRDLLVYALRNDPENGFSNWALDAGLMKPGPAGYYENVTAVGEEPFCRCFMIWIYALRNLPKYMLTKKGAAALEQARVSANA